MSRSHTSFQRRVVFHQVLIAIAMLVWMWTLTSKARQPMSISLLALSGLSLIHFEPSGTLGEWFKVVRNRLVAFIKTPSYSVPSLFFVGYLVSIIWSKDVGFLSTRMQLSAQAIAVPGVLFLLRKSFSTAHKSLWLVFAFFCSISALTTGGYLLFNWDSLVLALAQGRPIPTPVGHVRFAMALSFSAVSMVYYSFASLSDEGLGFFGYQLSPKLHQKLSRGFAVFLLLAVHLFAIRSGLATLYIGLTLLGVRFLVPRMGLVKTGVFMFIGLVILGFGVSRIPTIEHKIRYVKYDLERVFMEEHVAKLSDAGRIMSIRAAVDIVKDSPFLGAKDGDVRKALDKCYESYGYGRMIQLPHNQFLFSWVASGIAGLIGALCVFIGPMLENRWWKRPLLLEFLAMVLFMCMIEAPLESDIGASLCLLVIYLCKTPELGPDIRT